MLECFEHPCNTRCCYCPSSQILAVLLMQSNPVVCSSSPLRESALHHWMRFHWHYFILWENSEGGEIEHWPFHSVELWAEQGNGTCTSGEYALKIWLICWPPFIHIALLVHIALARDEAWSRPNLASHYLHFFICFTRNLYIITPVWKA